MDRDKIISEQRAEIERLRSAMRSAIAVWYDGKKPLDSMVGILTAALREEE